MQLVLDAVIDYLPSPKDKPDTIAIDPETDEEVVRLGVEAVEREGLVGQLQRGLLAGQMALGLHQGDHRPAHDAHHFPVGQQRQIHGLARNGRVAAGQGRRAANAADFMFPGAEAPAAGAQPAQVFHRVAPAGELPVEHGRQMLVLDHVIAGAKIAVGQRRFGAGRGVEFQPAQGPFEGRLGAADGVDQAPVFGHPGLRRRAVGQGQKVEGRDRRPHRVQLGQLAAQLEKQGIPLVGGEIAPHQRPGRGRTAGFAHEIEILAQLAGIPV